MPSTAASESRSTKSVVEELKTLLEKNIEGNVRLFGRLRDLAREATEQLGGKPGKRGLPSGSELFGRWLDLNLAYYSLLTDHGLAFLDDFLGAAEGAFNVRPAAPQAAEAVRADRAEITMTARQGETATAPFLVENHHPGALDLSFEAGEFVSTGGEAIQEGRVTFDPESLVLQPEKRAVVNVIAKVTPDFKVGQTYVSTIKVLGFENREIVLSLTVLPPLKVKQPAAIKTRNAKKRQQKRSAKPRKRAQD
jgi:hypothetical protein